MTDEPLTFPPLAGDTHPTAAEVAAAIRAPSSAPRGWASNCAGSYDHPDDLYCAAFEAGVAAVVHALNSAPAGARGGEIADGEQLRHQLTLAASALENWGHHHGWCRMRYEHGVLVTACDCGYLAAIQQAHDAARTPAPGAPSDG